MPVARKANVVPMNGPSVNPLVPWPIPGDIPSIKTIIADQALTIKDQEALLHAYQANLNTAQTPPTASATASGVSAVGNQMTVASVSGVIVIGASVDDAGATTAVPPGTTILGQISGTPGGAGVYLTSATTTVAGTPIAFSSVSGAANWPTPTDGPTLMIIQQMQASILRLQSSLLQGYQDLLTTSGVPAPPTGP